MFGTKWKFNKENTGFTIVEIIVVIAIIITAFIAILSFFIFENRTSDRGRIRLRAISLLEETMEAVRNFRDNTDWEINGVGTMGSGTNYHPVMASKSWDIISGNEAIDGFTRVIIFTSISRDANDNIEQTYNPLRNDSDTKKVSIIITWKDRDTPTSESLGTYITNWRR